MDMVRPDEAEMAFDPLDVVEHVLTAENLPFDRTADGDLAFALAGDWKDYELWFAWRPDCEPLHFTCAFDMQVPKARRPSIYPLLAFVNERLWLGHFDMFSDEGMVVFRHAMLLRGGHGATPEQMVDLVQASLAECERYYPAFQFGLGGGKSPEEAIAASILDTQGEA